MGHVLQYQDGNTPTLRACATAYYELACVPHGNVQLKLLGTLLPLLRGLLIASLPRASSCLRHPYHAVKHVPFTEAWMLSTITYRAICTNRTQHAAQDVQPRPLLGVHPFLITAPQPAKG